MFLKCVFKILLRRVLHANRRASILGYHPYVKPVLHVGTLRLVVVGPVLVAVKCCRVEGAALAAASVPNAKNKIKIKPPRYIIKREGLAVRRLG